MQIRNEEYVKQIIRIAEGNPRIAYMAGMLAIEQQNISAIRDVSQVYEAYYEKYVEGSLGDDKNLCFTAGILSVVNAVMLNNLTALQELLDNYKITKTVFVDKVRELARLEVVEIELDQVAKLSDQCLANYMLYYVFFQKKLLSFSDVLEIGYKHFRNSVMKSIDTIFSIFAAEDTKEYCRQEILKVWDSLKLSDNTLYQDFVRDFHVFKPEEAFIEAQQQIEHIEKKEYDPTDVKFNKNVFCDEESILRYMQGYDNSDYLDYVMELLLEFVDKNEETLVTGSKWLESVYGMAVNSYKYHYYTQIKISDYLLRAVTTGNSAAQILGYQWAKFELGFSFRPSEVGRKNNFVLYHMELRNSDGVKEYRSTCWEILSALVQIECFQERVLAFLDEYSRWLGLDIDISLLMDDIVSVKKLLSSLKSNRISFIKTVNRFINKYAELGIEFDHNYNELFASREWNLYTLLENDFVSSGSAYEEYKSIRNSRLIEYGKNLSNKDIVNIVQTVNNILSDSMVRGDSYNINHGLALIVQQLDETNLIVFLKELMNCGPNLSIQPSIVLQRVNKACDSEAILALLKGNEFPQQNEWLFGFFETLPNEKVTKELYEELILYLRSDEDKGIHESPFRNLRVLDKFSGINKDIYVTACSLIYEKRHYSPFVVKIYFESMFHEQFYSPQELLDLFQTDMNLLKDIYFFMLRGGELFDLDGIFLAAFLELGENWLQQYSVVFWDEVINRRIDDCYRSDSLWKSDHYIGYFDYLFYHSPMERPESWRVIEAFRKMLTNYTNDTVVLAHQEDWLFHIITDNAFDERIKEIFKIVCGLNEDFRKKAIQVFLDCNHDFESFRVLSILPDHWSGTGSLIPAYQRQIDYLESLFPLVSGIQYLKHKALIREKIELLKQMIKRDEVTEIYMSLYM